MKQVSLSSGGYALVDEEDYGLVSKYSWSKKYSGNNVYAKANQSGTKRKFIMTHRLIMGFPDSDVDHKNHDGLDNRRLNLRVCTTAFNIANSRKHRKDTSSKYMGVSFVSKAKGKNWKKPWISRFVMDGEKFYVGNFRTEEDAAIAYDIVKVLCYGEDISLNFGKEAHNSF